MNYNCQIDDKPSQPTLGVRTRTAVENLPAVVGDAYGAVIQHLTARGEAPAGPPFAIYYNMDMQDLDIEAGFLVARALPGEGSVQPGLIPGGLRATVLHSGPYEGLGEAYQALTEFIQVEGYKPTGVAYEFYLKSPMEFPPEELETLIMFPIDQIEG